MKARIHRAAWATWKAKAASIVAALALAAPSMAPRDLAGWLSAQMPFAPSWAAYGLALAIVVVRIVSAAK